jgi:acyl-CoA synthetase (AMP-forming)/AMP-acid ligase II
MTNLGLLLDMAADSHGRRPAYGSSGHYLSFEQLRSRARAIGGYLRALDPGVLVYIGRNGPLVPQLLFGSALAGKPFAPLNYRLSRAQLTDLIASLENPLVVLEDQYVERLVLAGAMDATTFLSEAVARGDEATQEVPEDLPAVLLFTSGTTAKPKAVVLRHRHLFAYVSSTVEFGGAAEAEAALVCVPPYHVAAIGSTLTNMYAGRRVVYSGDFDPAEWLRLAREESATNAMLVPTMLARIVGELNGHVAELPTLKTIAYGGAPMPQKVLEQALRAFSNAGFVNAYGLTETSSTIALLGPLEHRQALASTDPTVRARLASAGKPVPGIEVRIVDPRGNKVPVGVAGELWVRGAQVSGEYLEQGTMTTPDGWFKTRDRARLDPDGYLFVEGRLDDMIIRGGENIAPAEIEDVLMQHPGIESVAVVGVPDDEWGERTAAIVVRAPGASLTAEEVRAFARARLRGSRTPDDVVFREGLPYTPTGKLLRQELVQEMANAH